MHKCDDLFLPRKRKLDCDTAPAGSSDGDTRAAVRVRCRALQLNDRYRSNWSVFSFALKGVSGISGNDKLTQKQKRFVDEYLVSGNATQAALKAGYSKKAAKQIGTENLAKPSIRAYIEERSAEIASAKIASAREVMEFYSRVLRGEETEEIPMATAQEVVTVTKKPAIKDKIAVSKEILKRYPVNDPVEKQKLKKLAADARISEAKAKSLEDNGQDIELLLDKMLDTLAKEDLKNGSE